MYQVRDDLCIGCGLCAQSCPSGAITLWYGKAQIDPKRCVGCQICASVCPQGAIQPIFAGELNELKARIQDLKRRKDWVLERLNYLTPLLKK